MSDRATENADHDELDEALAEAFGESVESLHRGAAEIEIEPLRGAEFVPADE